MRDPSLDHFRTESSDIIPFARLKQYRAKLSFSHTDLIIPPNPHGEGNPLPPFKTLSTNGQTAMGNEMGGQVPKSNEFLPDFSRDPNSAIPDPGFHTPDSRASIPDPRLHMPNDFVVPILSLRRLSLMGSAQLEKSIDLPRVLQMNTVEQRLTKSPRYLRGSTAQYTSSSRCPIGLPDGGHIVLLVPLEQSLKSAAQVDRADQSSAKVSLPEKEIVRRTIKIKCRTTSLSLEDHQQHFGCSGEGAAKSLGAKRICRKHGINRLSTVKCIRKQHGIRRRPFRQQTTSVASM